MEDTDRQILAQMEKQMKMENKTNKVCIVWNNNNSLGTISTDKLIVEKYVWVPYKSKNFVATCATFRILVHGDGIKIHRWPPRTTIGNDNHTNLQ